MTRRRSPRDGERFLPPPLARLTLREAMVFYGAALGYSNDAIARHLGIALKTAKTHRASVNAKLGLGAPGALVRFAFVHRLVPIT